ncbi:MAG TPA: phosphate acyltransferase PlsX [Aliidongia sp.]|nr:phosphate acyltransferase PlsX [Aliidongia sp.]
MSKNLIIALDVMGGDKAPDMVLKGAEMALIRYPALRFALVGDEERIKPLIAAMPTLKAAATIVHAEDIVAGDAKPSAVLRSGKRTSMRLAIDAVAEGRADCAVSAGNTGALMAMAKMVLKTMPGIDRPAIASVVPTARGETVMLDMGANLECDAENLVQFALMGDAFARAVLGLVKPTVGLLNVGSEEMKGNDALREANTRLRAGIPGLIYHGFVEGDDIASGTVDVVVTDGFSGNIALKTAEGVVKLYTDFVRGAFRSSFMARIGGLLAHSALMKLRERLDPRRHNGAMFLGLNGIVVKSHGGADAFSFANAIAVAHDLSSNGFAARIKEELAALAAPVQPEPV